MPPPRPYSRDPATRWFQAVDRFDRDELARLLEAGIDVNLRGYKGRTALFCAVAPWGGDPATTAFLLRHGARTDLVDDEGVSVHDFAGQGVSSALEANLMRKNLALLGRGR